MSDIIVLDGCQLLRDERERSVTYKGTRGEVEYVVVQTIWKTWRSIVVIQPRSARLRLEREGDSMQMAIDAMNVLVQSVRVALAPSPDGLAKPTERSGS